MGSCNDFFVPAWMSCISVTICLTGMERRRNKSQVENIRQAHVISRIAVPMFRITALRCSRDSVGTRSTMDMSRSSKEMV